MQQLIPDRRHAISHQRRLGAGAALALMLLGAAPWSVATADESPSPPIQSPTPTPTPEPTPEPTPYQTPATDPTPYQTPVADPTPTTGPTAAPAPADVPAPAPTPVIDAFVLYRREAIVRQYTNYWCVPATTQTMLNLVGGQSDQTVGTQRRLYRAIRDNNRYRYRTLGNDPQGWAWGLRYYSGFTLDYQARSYASKTQALWAIADSIARTRHPVGALVRNGTHAWVVLGYRTASDPTEPAKRTLLGFYVSGPLAGTRDPWTYRYLSLADFRKAFTRYHEWQRRVVWEDKWVIISQ